MSSVGIIDLNLDNPWRTTYELRSALVWFISALILTFTTINTTLHFNTVFGLCLGAYLFAIMWAYKGYYHYKSKINLYGFALQKKETAYLVKRMKKDGSIWLGTGFEWKQEHTQRLYDLRKMGLEKVRPGIFAALLIKTIYLRDVPKKDAVGLHWIHGLVSNKEKDLYVFKDQWEGHSAFFGTTGAGKTQMMSILIQQNCLRGEATVILDPKPDHSLEEAARNAARIAGRKFYMLSLKRPEDSVRIDPLKNFKNISEIATRLGRLVPSTSEGDPFQAYAWQTLNTLAQCLVYTSTRPTISALRKLIQLGFESMVEKTLSCFFKENDPDAYERYAEFAKKETDLDKRNKRLVTMYKEVPETLTHNACNSIIGLYNHPGDHHKKMITSLIPILTMLTSGELESLLSPDPEADDHRLIVDAEQIIRDGAVFYVALDSLSDKTVSAATGSILLADFAALAGSIYGNTNKGKDTKTNVNLFVDEASEIVEAGAGGQGLVQLLNKSRGAGFRICVFSQTLSDWVKGLGSMEAALQVLGNTNNKFALRITDPATQLFMADMMGEIPIKTASYTIRTGNSGNNGDVTDYSGGYSESLGEEEKSIFAPQRFGELPNLEYIGVIAGGKIIKGRLPLILPKVAA
jgi:conjugal transfer pilus assembly protein TraD